MEGVAPIQDRLDAVFPYMSPQQVQQVALLFGPGGASAAGSPPAQVWQFDDGAGWSLNLSADTATLSVGPQYGEFSEFSDSVPGGARRAGRGRRGHPHGSARDPVRQHRRGPPRRRDGVANAGSVPS